MAKTITVNGSRGELTPLMHARVDTEFYRQAYALARNTVITRYGPHTRVPGTLHQGSVKNHAKKTRMLPFEFSAQQLYALEFGEGYLRFWTPEGQVMSGGVPYEIATSYTEAELPYLHGRQSGDVVYLWCNGKRPQVLRRLGETNWTLTPYKSVDGPYADVNTTSTTLALSSDQNALPIMTANDAPPPYVIGTTGAASNDFVMFNRSKFTRVRISTTTSGHVIVDLGFGNEKAIDNYAITADPQNTQWNDMPQQWEFQASNDSVNWQTLDSRDKEQGWVSSETRYYETDNTTAFRFYRFAFSGGGGDDSLDTIIGSLYLHVAPDSQVPAVLTASSTNGINGIAGFQPTDIGRPISLRGVAGGRRWAEIVGYLNPLQVTVKVHGQAFVDGSPIKTWALGAWSDTSGWPRTGRFFEDRLAQAGWATDPVGMALSVTGDYDSFRNSDPIQDDDAITIRMTGGRLDAVHWLTEAGTLLAGTGGGIRSIGGRDNSSVLKHDNLRQRLETTTAASVPQPANAETVSLFIDRAQRRLYELGFDYQSDGYIANEVSVLNDHLFKEGVEQVDYISSPYCTAVVRRHDGRVIFFTYDRGQKIVGGTLCDFGGFVEDLMVMAGRTYPDLWLVVRRTVNGQERRYVERLAPYWDGEIDPTAIPVYAASARVYDGADTATLTGLENLAGEIVGVWADGTDIGNATVAADGSVTLPYGKSAEKIVVGKRMPWKLQTLRAPNAQEGGVIGSKLRIVSAAVDVFETARIRVGGLQGTELLRDEDYSEHDPDVAEPILTKIMNAPVDDSFRNDGVFVIEGDSMYPATVRGVILEVESEP